MLTSRVQSRKVTALPVSSFSFEVHALQEALRLLQRGANLGKVVVRISDHGPLLSDATSLELAPLSLGARPGSLDALAQMSLSDAGLAVLELRDPLRFNTMSNALGDDVRRAVCANS